MAHLRINVDEDDCYVNAESSQQPNQTYSTQVQTTDASGRRPTTPNVGHSRVASQGQIGQVPQGQPPLSAKSSHSSMYPGQANKGGSREKINFATGDKDPNSQSEVSSSAAWLDAPPHTMPTNPDRQGTEGSFAEGEESNQRTNTVASELSQQVQLSKSDRPGSRKNFQTQDPRIAIETFDSSIEERREEKLVFKQIQRMDLVELKNHLNTTKDKFSVLNIYDKSGYSPLHYAAYKNIEKACEVLIEFVLQEDSDAKGPTNGGSGETGDRRGSQAALELRRQKLQHWLNTASRGDDGFTALHFAAFHGNMSLIRLLVKHGSNIHAQNRQGINMLHVSAQGDQPVSLAYFLEKGLEINSKDLRQSTPLHWAAFSGAELTLNYIIAWGGDLHAQDSKGLTPLHLAVKSYRENRSTKGIKQLLIKGANRNALDFETKKPVDYLPIPVEGERTDYLAIEIRKLLKDEWSFLGDAMMIKNTFKKQKKSSFTLIVYFLLMGLSFFLLEMSSYKLLRVSGYSDWLLWTSQALFGLSILLCVLVWLSDPGFIKKDPELNFVKLLDTLEASSLCPDCEVIRTPRCRHCTLCQRCVDRYDHHCPWVNNCIGKGNYAQFYIFVFVQSVYLFSVLAVSILYFKLEFFDDVYADFEDREMHPWHKYRRAAGILMSLLATLFLVSVLFLCWIQTGNLVRGETTCERFAKTNYKQLHDYHMEAMSMEQSLDIPVKKRLSIMSIDDNTNPRGICCGNMTGMCCNQKVMNQKQILSRTQDAYLVVQKANCEATQSDAGYSSNRDGLTSHRSRLSNAATPLINKESGAEGKHQRKSSRR